MSALARNRSAFDRFAAALNLPMTVAGLCRPAAKRIGQIMATAW